MGAEIVYWWFARRLSPVWLQKAVDFKTTKQCRAPYIIDLFTGNFINELMAIRYDPTVKLKYWLDDKEIDEYLLPLLNAKINTKIVNGLDTTLRIAITYVRLNHMRQIL
jgi:hypothetical protein